MPYAAAGPMFTDDRIALAGYQPSKSCITGIGGKAEGSEIPIITAMREFIEEIYCCGAPGLLVAQLAIAVKPRRRLLAGDYELLIYNFADLEQLLGIVASADLESPAYTRMPRTLTELILWRETPADADQSIGCTTHRPDRRFAEVGALALVPLGCDIGAEFVADGQLILGLNNN